MGLRSYAESTEDAQLVIKGSGSSEWTFKTPHLSNATSSGPGCINIISENSNLSFEFALIVWGCTVTFYDHTKTKNATEKQKAKETHWMGGIWWNHLKYNLKSSSDCVAVMTHWMTCLDKSLGNGSWLWNFGMSLLTSPPCFVGAKSNMSVV